MGFVGEPILQVREFPEFGPDFYVFLAVSVGLHSRKKVTGIQRPPKRSSMFEILSTNMKNIDILHQSEQALHDMITFCLSYFQPVNHYGTGQEASKLFEPTVEFGEL